MPTTDYEIPAYGQPTSRILGWCLEAEQEGRAWLEAQPPARGWSAALQMLSEPSGDDSIAGQSNVGYNKGKRVARELVASLANFRHEGEYRVTWNNQYYDQANTLTQLDNNWYTTTKANANYRAAIQYAVGTGTSYLLETWDKHYHSPFRGDIRLSAISPADVYFIQLPRDHDLQRAYAVIIREELPINLARAIWGESNPAFASALTPDRDQPGWLAKGLQKLQQFVSPALRVAGRSPQQNSNASFPTVDLFHMYVMDRTINGGPSPITMGVKDANWSYTVPAIGDPMPTSVVNPATGNYFTIPATEDHCRMFPLRRYTVFSRTGVAYDGSSPWWHGQVPLARIRFNDWAWEALGASLVGELKTMQDGIVALMRGIEDAFAAQLDPPMIYDDGLVSRTWAEAFNGRKAGARAAAPLSQGDPIKIPLDPAYYTVNPLIPEWIRGQEERMDYMAGTKDMLAIAKANQIPGADTLEKLMEMAGPIVQDLVRQVEEPLQQLGEWRKAYYFQFYSRARMLQITGPDGVVVDREYKPEQLRLLQPNVKPEARVGQIEESLDQFQYVITESGINEIYRMTSKLFYTQLLKLGFPISWWTFAKIAKIPNFGPPPEGTNTEMERWIAQKRIEIELAIDQQKEAAALTGGLPPSGMDGTPQDLMGRAGAGGNGNGGGPEGRPPSFNAPPKLESKDGGTRSTITTS